MDFFFLQFGNNENKINNNTQTKEEAKQKKPQETKEKNHKFETYQDLRNCRRAKCVKEMCKTEGPKNKNWARHKITISSSQTYSTTWIDSI